MKIFKRKSLFERTQEQADRDIGRIICYLYNRGPSTLDQIVIGTGVHFTLVAQLSDWGVLKWDADACISLNS
jgi:hypothetical protein